MKYSREELYAMFDAKRTIELSELWDNAEKNGAVPLFPEFLEEIDAALMEEINSDPIGVVKDLFYFFDSEEKPLNPREFLHFWVSLDEQEREEYILATTRPLPPIKGLAGIIKELGI